MSSILTSDESMDANDSKNIDGNQDHIENLDPALTDVTSGIISTSEDLELQKELEREYKKQLRAEAKRLAEEESLKKRKEKALKGMKYLLGVSEKYSKFFQEKVFSEDVKYESFS